MILYLRLWFQSYWLLIASFLVLLALMNNQNWKEITLRDLIWSSFKQNKDLPACGFLNKKTYSYGELQEQAEQLAFHFCQRGIKKGDKVAILGSNSPNWVVSYFSLLSTGIVSVPILPDFHTEEIQHILHHSGAKMLIISSKQLDRFSDKEQKKLPDILMLDDFSSLDITKDEAALRKKKYEPCGSFDPFNVELCPTDLSTLIYTSGTTGFSKGVMLTHQNLVENIRQCSLMEPIDPGEVLISILPLSHSLENTVGCLFPYSYGATTYYLEKPPTASILVKALEQVKPMYMLSVPLIIEKIYKARVKGLVNKSAWLKQAYRFPPFRKVFHRMAGKKLMTSFGGRIKFFGIGGAKLAQDTERFLLEAKFPYAIGYGLTETAPLIAGANPRNVKFQSAGKAVDGVELKINDPDKTSGIGEVWARGRNIMSGYYNEEKLTADVLMPDGWFRTGDLGIIDKQGFLYIKGRAKSVIVGSSGENIYPEEIESVINRFKFVLESVVLERKGKLVALVHFNIEELEKHMLHFESKIIDLQNELVGFVNTRVNRFSRIQLVEVRHEPFQKTATKKIKRFLYQ